MDKKTHIEQIREAIGEDIKVVKTPAQIEQDLKNTFQTAKLIDILKNS